MTHERALGGDAAMAVVDGSLRNSNTRMHSVACRQREVAPAPICRLMPQPPPDEFRNRVIRARSAMADAHLVGLVVSTQANFVYFTGLRFDPLWSSATRSMIAVIPADGPLHLCLPAFVADEAEEAWPDAVVHRYDVPPESVVPHVIDAIGALPTGPVGLELGREARTGVTPADFRAIVGHVDSLRVADGQDLLWSLRTVKSSYEIACLRAAARATSAAFAQALAGTLAGITERELARRIAAAAIGAGADTLGWIAITSGSGSYDRFVSAPRDRVIREGDLVWSDVGVRVHGLLVRLLPRCGGRRPGLPADGTPGGRGRGHERRDRGGPRRYRGRGDRGRGARQVGLSRA